MSSSIAGSSLFLQWEQGGQSFKFLCRQKGWAGPLLKATLTIQTPMPRSIGRNKKENLNKIKEREKKYIKRVQIIYAEVCEEKWEERIPEHLF